MGFPWIIIGQNGRNVMGIFKRKLTIERGYCWMKLQWSSGIFAILISLISNVLLTFMKFVI
jgi:hypothetical protein